MSVANAQLQESNQALIDQKWEGLATGVSSALLTVTSLFNLLIKNGTILKALTSAGSYFGGVFSGFFTLASTAINKITSWLFPAQVVGLTEPVAPIKETSFPETLHWLLELIGRVTEVVASSFLINTFGPDQ